MKFTLLKSWLLKGEDANTFSIRDNKSYSLFPFPIEPSVFESSLSKSEKETFLDFLKDLKEEKPIDLVVKKDYAIRHILFLSYLESFGEENIYNLLNEYKKEADEILEEAKGLKAKRLSDFPKENFAQVVLSPLASAETNSDFAKSLFEVPLEVTPLAKLFFNSPIAFWKSSKESSFLANEFDFLRSDLLTPNENLPKKKYDFLVSLIQSKETPAVLKEYYFDLLKKHLVFVDDFYFYPLASKIGLSLLNPFYWMNIQESVKDQSGQSHPIAKPDFSYGVFKRKGLYQEPYRIISKEDGYHFVYEAKCLQEEETESLNSSTKKEASYFLFSIKD